MVWDIYADKILSSSAASKRISEGGTIECPKEIPDKVFKEVVKCWEMDSSKRPSVSELLGALER
jgi:hypothetical protein